MLRSKVCKICFISKCFIICFIIIAKKSKICIGYSGVFVMTLNFCTGKIDFVMCSPLLPQVLNVRDGQFLEVYDSDFLEYVLYSHGVTTVSHLDRFRIRKCMYFFLFGSTMNRRRALKLGLKGTSSNSTKLFTSWLQNFTIKPL